MKSEIIIRRTKNGKYHVVVDSFLWGVFYYLATATVVSNRLARILDATVAHEIR